MSLDLLGEEVRSTGEVEAALSGYVACLDGIAANAIDGNISIKLTQLGLALDRDLARSTLERLAVSAGRHGLSSPSTWRTRLTPKTRSKSMPRPRRPTAISDSPCRPTCAALPTICKRLMPLGGHIRLCKGAYVEPESVAFTSTAEVDAAFARLLIVLMGYEGVTPAVATHDPELIELTRQLARQRRRPVRVPDALRSPAAGAEGPGGRRFPDPDLRPVRVAGRIPTWCDDWRSDPPTWCSSFGHW